MENNQELRAYFFNNMYLSGIHAGIQAQHCTAAMFVNYPNDRISLGEFGDRAVNTLYSWANHHKTTIILNGGYASNLYRILNIVAIDSNPYPWGVFCESEEALNSCITSVGIILPEKVFNYKKNLEQHYLEGGVIENYPVKLTEFELLLVEELSQCGLMS